MAHGCKPGSCWTCSLWVDLEAVGDKHIYNAPRELTKSCTGKQDKIYSSRNQKQKQCWSL